MLIVAGKIKIRADKHDEAAEAARTMAAATQQEAGCIEYQFYEDLADPNTFLVFERWESAEHLAAHAKTAHMAAFRQVIPSLVAAPGEIYRYDVTSMHKL